VIFTVEYRGWLKEGALEELERRLKRAAARQEWEVQWVEYEDFPLLRQDGDDYAFYHGPCRGYAIDFHPDSEPVRFYIEPNGCMQQFVRIRHSPVQTHVAIVEMLREVQNLFDDFAVVDDAHYWETGSTAVLERGKAIEEKCGRRIMFIDDSNEGSERIVYAPENEDRDEWRDPDAMPRIGYGFEYGHLDEDEEEWDEDEDEDEPLHGP
jgi:hypothetical protein